VHRFQAIAGLAMLGLILAMRFAQLGSGSARFSVLYLALVLSFLVFITVLMTRDVLTTRNVTLDTISESLAVYMLMGLTWAMAYQLLEFVEPGSFNFPDDVLPTDVSPIQRIMSFSYVTLTTLGYGNITPATPKADALASAQALVGQIYITVLVARLVALQVQNPAPPSSDDPR
jgi:voltage-gated potassium channel Kch